MTDILMILWSLWLLFISCICVFAPHRFQAFLLRRRERARGLNRLGYDMQFWMRKSWYPKLLRVVGLVGIPAALFLLLGGADARESYVDHGRDRPSQRSLLADDAAAALNDPDAADRFIRSIEQPGSRATEEAEESREASRTATESASKNSVDYSLSGDPQLVRITYRDPQTGQMKSQRDGPPWNQWFKTERDPQGYMVVERKGGTGQLRCEVKINGKSYYESPSESTPDKLVCKGP